MEVPSPLTGLRGISLPFTDFCAPLFTTKPCNWNPFEHAVRFGWEHEWRYIECRSQSIHWQGAAPSVSYYSHSIDLGSGPDVLFKSFKGSVRRGIKRAQASNLRVTFSSELDSVRNFYDLHCATRQRHGLPPQPFKFFENIARHVLAHGHGVVISAFFETTPVAAAVFFQDRRQAFFKFGASNYSFQNLRPNNLVMWEAIKWYAQQGLGFLHLGRTSRANGGLRRFKVGFGAEETEVAYCKYSLRKGGFVSDVDRSSNPMNRLFRCLPLPVLRLSGQLLYPHLE
jgi:hypothetical protein